jgi:hypothetical protein
LVTQSVTELREATRQCSVSLVGGVKGRIVQETNAPGMSVALVARQHRIAPNYCFPDGGSMLKELL